MVCSVGNDATDAARASRRRSRRGRTATGRSSRSRCPPIVSVGALNPNLETDAMFSNVGPWVRAYVPGAAVMSTFPTTFQGGPAVAGAVHGVRSRPRHHRPRRLPRRLRGVERHVVLGSARRGRLAARCSSSRTISVPVDDLATAISRAWDAVEDAHGDPAMMSAVLTAEELHRRAVEAVNHGRVRRAATAPRAGGRAVRPTPTSSPGSRPACAYVAMRARRPRDGHSALPRVAGPRRAEDGDRGVALAQLGDAPHARGADDRRAGGVRRGDRAARRAPGRPGPRARNRGDVLPPRRAGCPRPSTTSARQRRPSPPPGATYGAGQGRAQPRLRAAAGGRPDRRAGRD